MESKVGSLALKFGAWLLIVVAPIQASMLAVGGLIAADFITGVWAAVKRGEKFTSWGMRKTVSKTLAYQLAIVLAFVMERNFLDMIPLVKATAGFIAATEFKSALENLAQITGLDFWTAIRGIVQGTKSNPDKVAGGSPSDVAGPSKGADKAP